MIEIPAEKLRGWFLKEKRSFPWRENPTPYRVWISEIMLQQTRASVVVGYFNRWMKLFPTISSVAAAPLEELIKAWEGLGYYSRVKNIKKAAGVLAEKGGELPDSVSDLLEIQGIGSYTAGAIASFAFHKKAAAVDGNVTRVISRYYALEGEVKKSVLEEKTLHFLPNDEPWVVMEALIELGATFCGKSPRCESCLLRETCRAHIEDKTDVIPILKKRASSIYLHKQVFLLVHDDEVLIERKKEGSVLGGLIEFPSLDYSPLTEGSEEIKNNFALEADWMEDLEEEKQSFTRYQLDLSPSVFRVLEKKDVSGYIWAKTEDLTSLTFSAGHKRILGQFLERKRK